MTIEEIDRENKQIERENKRIIGIFLSLLIPAAVVTGGVEEYFSGGQNYILIPIILLTLWSPLTIFGTMLYWYNREPKNTDSSITSGAIGDANTKIKD